MTATAIIGKATVHNLDCMDYMAVLPDNYFDLAIVDPPYFEGPNKSGYYGKGYSSLGVKRAKHYDDTDTWDIPDADYFKELKRVSKNQIIWGANHLADKFDASSPSWIVWDKDNGKSTFADAELAYTSFRSAVRIFKYMWNGMHQGSFGGNVKLNETRIHPTQKPVKLYEWLLMNFAQSGQRILDTHLGSMSIVVAANNLGFELHGTEKNKTHFDNGCARCIQELKQERMFA